MGTYKIKIYYWGGKSEIKMIEAPSVNQAVEKARRDHPTATQVNSVGT